MRVDQTVVDVKSKKMGRIVETRILADGYNNTTRYLVDFNGLQAWKDENEIMRYITNEGTEHGGQFLTES